MPFPTQPYIYFSSTLLYTSTTGPPGYAYRTTFQIVSIIPASGNNTSITFSWSPRLPGPSKPHSSQTSPNIAYTSTNYCLLAKRFGKNYYSPSTEPVPEHLCQLLLETFNMPHILALPPLLPALGSLYLPLAAFASFFAASSLKSFAFRVPITKYNTHRSSNATKFRG